MNLYIISQDENNDYDTYDSAVVAAPDVETARKILPDECCTMNEWCSSPDMVEVECIGIAGADVEQGVILASFNAG